MFIVSLNIIRILPVSILPGVYSLAPRTWKEEVVTRGSPFSVENDAETLTVSAWGMPCAEAINTTGTIVGVLLPPVTFGTVTEGFWQTTPWPSTPCKSRDRDTSPFVDAPV